MKRAKRGIFRSICRQDHAELFLFLFNAVESMVSVYDFLFLILHFNFFLIDLVPSFSLSFCDLFLFVFVSRFTTVDDVVFASRSVVVVTGVFFLSPGAAPKFSTEGLGRQWSISEISFRVSCDWDVVWVVRAGGRVKMNFDSVESITIHFQ